MTVVTRDAATPAASGVPQTKSQRSTKPPATAAGGLVREFPRKPKKPVRAHQGLLLTVDQGKVHGR